MTQLDELKSQRIDRQPPVDGVERAMDVGGRRRRRVQRLSVATVVVVAAIGVTVPTVWPSRGDTARISAATPPATAAPPPSTSSAADQAVLHQLISVPAASFEGVGTDGVTAFPTKVSGAPLTFDGKPGIFFYGAEYSPFAAAERWPLVLALSRFGTWSTLNTTVSSSSDVRPNTPTFTFFNSTYSSPYLTFQSVETSTNEPLDIGYKPLLTPTAEQTALVNAYDSSGSIPFIDFGNASVLIGSSYNADVLAGRSASEIAAAASEPSTDIGRSVIGTANTMTAAICEATGGQPGSVCNSPTITRLRTTLHHG
ncbi:MAG: hypothetical protein JWN96_1765 [Mycobacterium sp.]|nr:hypothetical protein [Mycobacterium sp.]